MTVISDFAAKQNAFNQRQGDAVDKAVAALGGLTTDMKTLNDKITELQNSPGTVSPEDQASLDSLQAQGEAIATKTEAVAAALDALDALTPPPVPAG